MSDDTQSRAEEIRDEIANLYWRVEREEDDILCHLLFELEAEYVALTGKQVW